MYVDSELLLTATAMDLTETSGTIIYGDQSVNVGSVIDQGKGRPMYMVICIDTALTSASSTATVVFALVDDNTATIDSGSVEIVQTDPLVVTRLTLGKIIVIPIPAGLITQQYLGVRAKIGVDTVDTGTATIFLALDPHTNV